MTNHLSEPALTVPARPQWCDRVEAALAQLRAGRPIVVSDDESRENEGDLIAAAEHATAETVAFFVRHTSGVLCVALSRERADELDLPMMVARSEDPKRTAFTVSVDYRYGITTGISAADRSLTVRALADVRTGPGDLTRPGHVFPLRAVPGGVLRRAGHTESAVDLCRLAGLSPVGLLSEVVAPDGDMASGPGLARFAAEHQLVAITVDDIIRYRRRQELLVERVARGRVPTRFGSFTAIAYRSTVDGGEHVAFVMGEVDQADGEPDSPVPVRVHSECLTGDVFGSCRCDCGEQLTEALSRIGAAGRGVVVYLRGHEGRGIGLAGKLRAYELQDEGLDTVDANLAQGFPVDSRDYATGAQILRDLGVRAVELLSNNPAKIQGLCDAGVAVVARRPIVVPPNADNLGYLLTKRIRLGHLLEENDAS